MADKILKKIFEDSEKAEFLENIDAEMTNCRRAIIGFESPHPDVEKASQFNFAQFGFKQNYEVQGFLDMVKDLVEGAEAEASEGLNE